MVDTNFDQFQYLSLLRFGSMMAKRYKEASTTANEDKTKVQDLTTLLQDTKKETADLRLQIDELRVVERKYKSFKKREPEIRHLLGNFATLAK